jgi:alpha-tubulin suppressor-like RCC1 family protein
MPGTCKPGDTCANPACDGSSIPCTTPPAPACASGTTLRTYASSGVCASQACTYSFVDTACAAGCSNAACNPPVVAISSGSGYTCALLDGGAVACWGDNGFGVFGDGTNASSATPVHIASEASGVLAVSAGAMHACTTSSLGLVECSGFNFYGELGNGTTTSANTPVTVITIAGLWPGAQAVSAGYEHTCAVTSAGGVKCWGWNPYGQLGNNSTTTSATPVNVTGLASGVVAVSAGMDHTCALTAAGGVKCWGRNNNGQLGNGTTTDSHVPVDVVGLSSGVRAISAGREYACAINGAGGLKCWGENAFGALGDNNDYPTENFVSSPVDVVGLSSGVQAVSTGQYTTCAITSTGGVKCWGENESGELGNGSMTNSLIPSDVVGLSSGVQAVSMGDTHACALTSAGAVKCWGHSAAVANTTVPIDIVGF